MLETIKQDREFMEQETEIHRKVEVDLEKCHDAKVAELKACQEELVALKAQLEGSSSEADSRVAELETMLKSSRERAELLSKERDEMAGVLEDANVESKKRITELQDKLSSSELQCTDLKRQVESKDGMLKVCF